MIYKVGQRVKVAKLLDDGMETDVYSRYLNRVGATGEIVGIDTSLSGEWFYEVRFDGLEDRLHAYAFLSEELEAADGG